MFIINKLCGAKVKDLFPKMEVGNSNSPTCKPRHLDT